MFTGLFRRYQRTIWLFVAILIIPPFVIFFSPHHSPFEGRDGLGQFGTLDGKQITQTQFLDARKEAVFRMRVYTGRWPQSEEQLNEFTYYQLLIAQQIKEQGIHVSEEAATGIALSFGVSDIKRFLELARREARMALTESDFIRFCQHEAGFMELRQLASLSGQLVQPREVESDFKHQYEENVVEAVFFSGSDYTNSVTVTPAAVTNYYAQNSSSLYRLPERVKVSYIEFSRSNFLSQAESVLPTNIVALADEEFRNRGTNALIDPKNPSVTLTEKEAKAKIQDDLRNRGAVIAAYNKATEVADKMMASFTNVATVQLFESFAASQGLKSKISSEFSRQSAPSEFGLRTDTRGEIVSRIFDLTNQNAAVLFTPVMGEEAVYLVALKQRIPSSVEPFEAVKSRATADYIRSTGRDSANRAGRAFVDGIHAQLSSGKLFSEAAAASRLRVETLPPFSRETESLPDLKQRLDLNTLKNTVGNMTNGAVSRYLFTMDGGAVLHLKERRQVSAEVRNEKFASFVQEEKMQRMQDAMSSWFEKVAQERLHRPDRKSDQSGQGQDQ